MSDKKKDAIAAPPALRDPFALLRQMTSEFDRVFDAPLGSVFDWPAVRRLGLARGTAWAPRIDVFERDNRLVTKVDLPGLKKEDVRVEITDGHLAISGHRKNEMEEEKDDVFRCERSFGSFYRAVPLPQGVRLEDVKATFDDGVLEVSVPLAAKEEAKPRTVTIEEPEKVPAATAA